MNLTITQAYHRTQNLGGEIKAAQSALADCEADAQAKERIASIAVEAVNKAKASLAALEQEREKLAEHMADLVRKAGEPISDVVAEAGEAVAEMAAPDKHVHLWSGDSQESFCVGCGAAKYEALCDFEAFGHPLQNGDDSKLSAAFDRATTP